MLIAELNGKLPEVQNAEDVLTSNVFGLLKYLKNKRPILNILNKAETLKHEKFNKCISFKLDDYDMEFIFWDKLSGYGEPDLIIKFKGKDKTELILCIEVKFYSDKSGEGDNDQLKRYFEGLHSTSIKKNTKFLGVIYLTKYPSSSELEDSLKIIKDKVFEDANNKLFQLRWHQVTTALEEYGSKVSDEYDKAILQDIINYLKYKNLTEFTGFTFQQKDFPIEIDNFYSGG